MKTFLSLSLFAVVTTAALSANSSPVVLPELQVRASRAENLDADLKAGAAKFSDEALRQLRQENPLAGVAATETRPEATQFAQHLATTGDRSTSTL